MIFKSKEKSEQRERIIAYKRTFGGDDGKVVLYNLMNNFHVLNAHKGDAFAEGQRSVVLHILNQCHISIQKLDELLKGETNE